MFSVCVCVGDGVLAVVSIVTSSDLLSNDIQYATSQRHISLLFRFVRLAKSEEHICWRTWMRGLRPFCGDHPLGTPKVIPTADFIHVCIYIYIYISGLPQVEERTETNHGGKEQPGGRNWGVAISCWLLVPMFCHLKYYYCQEARRKSLSLCYGKVCSSLGRLEGCK